MRTFVLLALPALAASAVCAGHLPVASARSAPAAAASAPAVSGNVGVTVPRLATSASDGLPSVLGPGRHAVRVPVWASPGTPAAPATVTVNGVVVARAVTVPGAVVWLRGPVRSGAGAVTVVLAVGGTRVHVFSHRTSS